MKSVTRIEKRDTILWNQAELLDACTKVHHSECIAKEYSCPSGKDVYLTIDIFLQIAAEDALADNIQLVVDKAAATEGDLDGEDVRSRYISVIYAVIFT